MRISICFFLKKKIPRSMSVSEQIRVGFVLRPICSTNIGRRTTKTDKSLLKEHFNGGRFPFKIRSNFLKQCVLDLRQK